jgi:hypothetical protein
MRSLVGIPWSGNNQPPEGADCFSLAVYAQRVLWGREISPDLYGDVSWNPGDLLSRSRDIETKVGAFSERIEGLEVGGLVVVRIVGYDHLMTCLEPGSVLHIMQNSTSRISRWGRAFESRVRSFWRVRGDL